jgi:hypothetical protein
VWQHILLDNWHAGLDMIVGNQVACAIAIQIPCHKTKYIKILLRHLVISVASFTQIMVFGGVGACKRIVPYYK